MSSKNFPLEKYLIVTWLTLVIAVLGISSSWAQEAKYTQAEYNEYQIAIKDGEDGIIAFLNEHPESALKPYAVGAYKEMLKKYLENKNHQKAAASGEKFLSEIDGDDFEVLYLTTWSSFYSGQYEKAIQFGEQTYQMKPDAPQLVPILARSYQKTGKTEKALPLAEETCAEVAPAECYDLLPMIMRHYAEEKDWAKASEYARKVLTAFENIDAPQGVAPVEWEDFVDEERAVAHTILGKHAYEEKNWQAAQEHYEVARELGADNRDRTAEGYYYIGMSLWNLGEISEAMEAFAHGTLMEGTVHADASRKQLEKLYRADHNGSLAGFDEYLSRF